MKSGGQELELMRRLLLASAETTLPLWKDTSGVCSHKVGKRARLRPFEEVSAETLSRVYRTAMSKKFDAEMERLRKSTAVEILIPELRAD